MEFTVEGYLMCITFVVFGVFMSQGIAEIGHFRKCLGNSGNAWSYLKCLGISGNAYHND